MSLDWVLDRAKPMEGFEAEYDQVMQARRDAHGDPRVEGLTQRLIEISIPASAFLTCPRVGIDEEATEWFREREYESNRKEIEDYDPPPEFVKFWRRTFKECLSDFEGQPVIELAKERSALPKYRASSGPLDFGGGFVGKLQGLPDDLAQRAYQDHPAAEALDYAALLHEQLCITGDENSADILRNAVQWLEFWGGNGFGFVAWF